MFCPNCKAEYRSGFTRCSDCGAELVSALPQTTGSPENANADTILIQLWVGADPAIRQEICEALDLARIGYMEEPVQEISNAAERLLPFPAGRFFPFAVLVQPSDLLPARDVLDEVLGREQKLTSPVGEHEPSANEVAVPEASKKAEGIEDSRDVKVWSGEDTAKAGFIAAALREVEIENRLEPSDSGLGIVVSARDAVRAKQVVAQVAEGTLPTESVAEGDRWTDEPPRSYLLAWLLPLLSVFLFILAPSGVDPDRSPFLTAIFFFGVLFADVGALWMLYQAIRYEVRPLSYCLIALFPFTFIWYYIERYSQRRGAQRLPVAVRTRA